jgi:hypothetical protein
MAASKFPMQEQETLSIKPMGLWTYPNALSAVPQGALKRATNAVIDRPNIIEQRRGIAPFGTVLSADTNKLYSYQNRIIIQYGAKLAYDSDGLGTWVDYNGSYSVPPNALTIHSIQANKNIYFATGSGIKKLDSLTGTIVQAGAPAGLDGSGSVTGSGWFTNNTQVAYRIVFGYNDANGNLILGAPSQRIVVSNSSGSAKNVSLVFTLPDGMTTSWFYQIYRSPMSVDLATEPNDELGLVYTGKPTAGELTAKVITATDNIDDSLKGATIYTASSQQGIAQANTQPPIAADITYFKGSTFYANTIKQQQFFLTLVVVGSPNGIQIADTITIGGITYTGAAAENIAAAQFLVYTAGTPSQNITETANSLVRVINRHAGNTTIYAYYQSGYNDTPGKILLSTRIIGTASFTAISTRGAAFVPNLTSAQTSSNETEPNVVYISKSLQPEAVPILQKISIGSADKSILRIIALRDYVMIFKQDGVFQIVGSDINSFQQTEVDKTLILRGIETAVSLNNKVFLFSNQTVVSITFNEGAVLKSLPIRKDLINLSSPTFPNFDTVSFGIGDESENKYILGVPTTNIDVTATQYYIYNYITDAWTQWTFPFPMKTGFTNPIDGKLYFGSGDPLSRYVRQERKNALETDYADDSYPVTIVSSLAYTIELSSTVGLLAGWVIAQGNSKATIVSVPDLTHIVVNQSLVWTAGAATVYQPIQVSLEFILESMGNPGIVKHFKEVHTIFSQASFSLFRLGFSTDFSPNTSTVSLVPKSADGFGLGGWGEFPWGSGALDTQVIRALVPLAHRRGHWLYLSVNYEDALTFFALDGFAIYYQTSAQKFH